MEKRVQRINDDTILEITDQEEVKTRFSEKNLLRRKAYLEAAIKKFQASLDATNAALTDLYAEAAKA